MVVKGIPSCVVGKGQRQRRIVAVSTEMLPRAGAGRGWVWHISWQARLRVRTDQIQSRLEVRAPRYLPSVRLVSQFFWLMGLCFPSVIRVLHLGLGYFVRFYYNLEITNKPSKCAIKVGRYRVWFSLRFYILSLIKTHRAI